MRLAKPWKIAESAYYPGETALDEMNDSNVPNDSNDPNDSNVPNDSNDSNDPNDPNDSL